MEVPVCNAEYSNLVSIHSVVTLPVTDMETDYWISQSYNGVRFMVLRLSYNQQLLLQILWLVYSKWHS